MRRLHRSERVQYSAAQMFDLVNDVDSYPRFLHWCRDARVERRERNSYEAVVDIGMRGIHKRFRTRNSFEAPRWIRIELISGPFRRLEGQWRFEDLDAGGSEVSLALDFDVAAGPFSMLFSLAFEEITRSQMAAFMARARTVYG